MSDVRRLRSIDHLLSDSWRLLCSQWRALLVVRGLALALSICFTATFLGSILITLVGYAFRFGAGRSLAHPSHWQAIVPLLVQCIVPSLAIVLLFATLFVICSVLLSTWSRAGIAYGAAQGTTIRADPWAICLRAIGAVLPLLWLELAVCCIVLGGFLWLFIPAWILGIGLSQAWYIRVLEERSLWACLNLSWVRTRGHRWAILGRYLLVTLCILGAFVVVAMLKLFPIIGLVLAVPLHLTLQLGIPVFFAVAGYLMYLDLRPPANTLEDPRAGPTGWLIFFAICGVFPLFASVGTALFYLLR